MDDSPTIHRLLEKILVAKNGFKIVATATNGEEAAQVLRTKSQEIDIISLDIEMPVLNGPGFLEKYKNLIKVPVVMLSSLNRDDMTEARKCVRLGAADYVQKPKMSNFSASAEEIIFKLKSVAKYNKGSKLSESQLGKSSKQSAARSLPVDIKATKNKRVLVVDDSAVIRKIVINILNDSDGFTVVADTGEPEKVNDLIYKHNPDLMILDLMMPGTTGVEVLKNLPKSKHVPTLIFSALAKDEGSLVLEALELGAIDYLKKPSLSNIDKFTKKFLDKIEIVAGVKAIRRSFKSSSKVNISDVDTVNQVIGIGSSTGGTDAIKNILTSFPEQIPAVLIAQHIPEHFSRALAERLDDVCPFKVKEAEHNEIVKPGCVYIAPGGHQMTVRSLDKMLKLIVKRDDSKMGFKPSVDKLFESLAEVKSKSVTGVILTGMGKDGTIGLGQIVSKGGKSIVQDEASCVVYGMPKSAIEAGHAQKVTCLSEISNEILKSCSVSKLKKSA